MRKTIFANKKGQLAIELTTPQKIGFQGSGRGFLQSLFSTIGIPAIAFGLFLGAWSLASSHIETSLGKLPGPSAAWAQAQELWQEHWSEKLKEKEFYQKQLKQNAQILAEDPSAKVKIRKYTGKPTYFDQILTSLLTVFTGFFLASLIAVPVGILCGLNRTILAALNPFIQIFRPVSPLAWLPLVSIVVSAVYATQSGGLEKCFIISAITVALCSLWPTIINTAQGVASVDKDIINVSRVLKLGWFSHVFKIIIPSSLPLIFTGLKISLGVGWMVLIASEMLAQNPGLGKFVWDEFQNGSSNSLARIMVAILTIGIIGFFLDRVMVMLQKAVSFQR